MISVNANAAVSSTINVFTKMKRQLSYRTLASAIIQVYNNFLCKLNAQASISQSIKSSSGAAQAWYQRLNLFKGPANVATPVALGVTQDSQATVGVISLSGKTVNNSGSAKVEYRYLAWAADATATVVAAGATGVAFNHNLATSNHITLVYGDGSANLGEVYIVRGSNSDTIYNTGSYTGNLTAVAIKATNAKSAYQNDYVVDATGKFITADADTVPLVMANADTGGKQGELYAVRESGGWRIKRTGSADISCRIAICKLI